jgi:ABC-type transport system involved in cytochrome c biogenesis permease subunit
MNIIFFAPPFLYIIGAFYRPLIYAGFLLQAGYLFARGVDLGRIPLVGLHDTLVFFSSSVVAFSIPFYKGAKEKKDFFYMLGFMAAVLSSAALFSKPHGAPLPPVLKTYWFELHVILSFFSYALFAIAAILGAVYLIRLIKPDEEDSRRLLSLQYKGVLMGYSLFSLSMIFGGIWAFYAWGSYWLWTPKELWTTILWIFYSIYLHARLLKWRSGKIVSVLAIAGFLIVLFTYLGVGLLMKSSHSF